MRIKNLDFLRGLASVGIMMYHFTSWSFGLLSATSFLGRVGIYGVSIFYVLSGLTLYAVYSNKLDATYSGLKLFYTKRFYRISVNVACNVPNNINE